MAQPRGHGRSRSREPYRSTGRGGGWNTWTRNSQADDRGTEGRNDFVYRARRNDPYLRRDYEERHSTYESHRPHRDSRDDRGRSQDGSRGSSDLPRRRASMHEPSASASASHPQINRGTSFQNFPTANYTESPSRSPLNAPSPAQSPAQSERSLPSASAAGQKNSERVMDPRLRPDRSASVPHPLPEASKLHESRPTPSVPLNTNMDGPSEAPSDEHSTLPVPQDVQMTDADHTQSGGQATLANILLQFIQQAVATGVWQQRIDVLQGYFNEAKQSREKLEQFKTVPALVHEQYKKMENQTRQNHLNASKGFPEAQISVLTMANDVVSKVFSVISDISSKHHREDAEPWRAELKTKVQSLEQEMNKLRPDFEAVAQLSTLQDQQNQLQSRIDQAHPQVEENIDFLKSKAKDQKAEVSKLRAENVSLRAEVKELKTGLDVLRDVLPEIRSQYLLKSELDTFKAEWDKQRQDVMNAISEANTTFSEEISIRDDIQKVRSEVDAVRARIAGLDATAVAASEALKRSDQNETTLNQCQQAVCELRSSISHLDASGVGSTSTAAQLLQDDRLDTELRKIRDEYAKQQASIYTQIRELEDKLPAVDGKSSSPKNPESHAFKPHLEGSREQGSGQLSDLQNLQEAVHQNFTATDLKLAELNKLQEDLNSLATELHSTDKQLMDRQDAIQEQVERLSRQGGDISRNSPIENTSGTLTTRQKALLNSVEALLKRVNDLEITVLDLTRRDGQTSAGPSDESVKEFQAQINDFRASFEQLRNEVTEQFTDSWDKLQRLQTSCRDNFESTDRKTEKLKADVTELQKSLGAMSDKDETVVKELQKSCASLEHAMKSLTSRYNNLTSERMAWQIADIVQPVPAQLQGDIAALKTRVAQVQTQQDEHQKAVERLDEAVKQRGHDQFTLDKAKDVFVQLSPFYDVQTVLVDRTDRIEKLEANTLSADVSKEFSELKTQFNDGRKKIEDEQKDHDQRLKRLEGRVAHAHDWDPDDEDEDRLQRVGSALLRQFAVPSDPASMKVERSTSRGSTSSSSGRQSPAEKIDARGSERGLSGATPAQQHHQQTFQTKSNPSRPLAERVENPKRVPQLNQRGKRPYIISDSEEENGDSATAQPPYQAFQGGPKKKARKNPKAR